MEKTFKNYTGWNHFFFVIFFISFFQLAYQIDSRTDILGIWLGLGFAFLAYFVILSKYNKDENIKSNHLLMIGSRLLILFSFPLLSDDIYRFIWDGSLLHHGINPFSLTPSQ